MKIKRKNRSFDEILSIPAPAHRRPQKPWMLFRCLIRVLSIPDMLATSFTFTKHRMEEAGEGPYLILMNHSSFIDLKIAYRIFFPKPFCIVCTSDGFVGKNWLMRKLGCIPTRKFVTDIGLIGDILHAIRKERLSVLMFPEASYSFDGTATPLPRRLGKLLKKLDVPVVMVKTEGAFLRNPLYNELQQRKVKVSAEVSCLLTREEIQTLPADRLDEILDEAFTFDHFATQKEKQIPVAEEFRADGLERILYRCPHCQAEGTTLGKGTRLTCSACGKEYQMDIFGVLSATDGRTAFSHIPDWYRWERETVREEILRGTYRIESDVEIGIMADYKAIYMVGKGHLTHTAEGFTLTGCDGKLHYIQPAQNSYSLYADYFWYEVGDVICIGNHQRLYYCFPLDKIPVAKARLAAEEIFKIARAEKKADRPETAPSPAPLSV
ncbi:MAG: 1-acyl-sn-glycerol-3-phosphate acyltransferase [Oscillospiraceae bacterium]|nr:1-acyl-sn-glycerol-3-phosphate acyltransferase [Oscillospiraceae bacterium]